MEQHNKEGMYMKNNVKKIVVILISVFVILMITLMIYTENANDKTKENSSAIIDNNKAKNDVIVDKVIFSNITKVYDSGITTLKAEMLNNTDETKNFQLEIILKDDDGNAVKSIMQVIENLEPNKTKILTTGIAGDYTNIKNIEFKITESV